MRTLTLIVVLILSFAAQAERTVTWTAVEDFTNLSEAIVTHSDLKDPFSVRFRNIYRADITDMVDKPDMRLWCGEIAAKNSFGAYTGFVPFLLNESGYFKLGGSDDEYGMNIIAIRAFCEDSPSWAHGRIEDQ